VAWPRIQAALSTLQAAVRDRDKAAALAVLAGLNQADRAPEQALPIAVGQAV